MIEDLQFGNNPANKVRKQTLKIDEVAKINERHFKGLDKWGTLVGK